MNPVLNLVNVTLEYPDGESTLKALDSVHLRVDAGEFFSLVGPSGSGKSSLLAVAATLVGQVPDSSSSTAKIQQD
ncbi:ATP-binding cassette domain-containing protein [Amycolatopsis plumensis]|uniref:ATP-binding cassette domain-containing protein n=1 Tax=Amycolatopsis plumensis TaxID=236508 RepID=UPI003617929C